MIYETKFVPNEQLNRKLGSPSYQSGIQVTGARAWLKKLGHLVLNAPCQVFLSTEFIKKDYCYSSLY